MGDELRKLLFYIVSHSVMQNASREAQVEASAVQDVQEEISKIEQDSRRDAERLAEPFAQGLRRAARGPLTVDDTDPVGNQIADAFARFLVAPGLASSQSVPLADSHFRYTFDVNWPALQQLAQRAGIDLDGALSARGN